MATAISPENKALIEVQLYALDLQIAENQGLIERTQSILDQTPTLAPEIRALAEEMLDQVKDTLKEARTQRLTIEMEVFFGPDAEPEA